MSRIALFPLHTVLFPGMALPLHIFEPRYRRMVHACLHDHEPFGVLLIRAGREVGGPAVPYHIGTLARIRHVEHLPDGRMNIEAIGEQRFRLLQLYAAQDEVHTGEVEDYPLQGGNRPGAYAAARALSPWLIRYLDLLGQSTKTHLANKPVPTDPAGLACLAASVVQVPPSEKQTLLSVADTGELLELERALLRRETSLMRAMLRTAPAVARRTHCPN